jgi:hypothetical protein
MGGMAEGCALATYNLAMARGWESKSIEAQQAEASEKSSAPRLKLSREEASRQREIEVLRLSRQRVLQELGASQHEQRRKVLEEALRELDKKLQSP